MKKFLIWTVQRTGSTSLASILSEFNEQAVLHEPFNVDRKFGYDSNLDMLAQQIEKLKSLDFDFKHCWNAHAKEYNELVLKSFIDAGYEVIFLVRQNALAMEISRQLAEQTGVWSKAEAELTGHSKTDQLDEFDLGEIKNRISSYWSEIEHYKYFLEENEKSYLEISYENLFSGILQSRLYSLSLILKFLDVESKELKKKSEKIKNNLLNNRQNNEEVYDKIPNLRAIERSFPQYSLSQASEENQKPNFTGKIPLVSVSNIGLTVGQYGLMIESCGTAPVYVKDQQGHVNLNRFPWIVKFLHISELPSVYEVVFENTEGKIAIWYLDKGGNKVKYKEIDPF